MFDPILSDLTIIRENLATYCLWPNLSAFPRLRDPFIRWKCEQSWEPNNQD